MSLRFWPVIIARGPHPFPSRTRSLSLAARMVLPGRPGGRVRRRRPMLQKPRSAFTMRGSGLLCVPLRLRRVWRLISRRERRGGTAEDAGLEQRIWSHAETRAVNGETRIPGSSRPRPSTPTVLAWTIAPARPPARHVCLQRMRRGRPRCSGAPETSSVVSNKHDAGAATKDTNRGDHSHGKAAPSVSAVTPVSPR